jgi:putative SOS response-associated peptidase YedK
MFKRYILASNLERVSKRFSMVRFPDSQCYKPSFNIFLGSDSCVITNKNAKEIQAFRFGITGLGKNFPDETYFVRSEGNRNKHDDPAYTGSKAIFLQPELRAIIRTQRCLVLADAYVVEVEKQNPHLIYLRNKKRPFAFAGIWSEDKEGIESFAIITTPSNELLYKLGLKRMPVILPIQYDSRWIRQSTELAEVLGMLNPYPTVLMNAYPIANNDDSSRNDISLVQPVGKPVIQEPTTVYAPHRKKKPEKDYTNVPTLGERVGYREK